MKRILLGVLIVLVAVAFIITATGASNSPSATGTYKIELDNAFGLVQGADFKVAGVKAGSITSIDLCYSVPQPPGQPTRCPLIGSNTRLPANASIHALVSVNVTQAGFGQFHTNAFCQTRPQSLIGEYFVECEPGNGPADTVLQPESIIPVTNTESTIPGDLLQDVMRMPYRERFTLIINELGAGVAGRPQDLQAALRRAVPALTETDNLLNLLANDSSTLQRLTADSDTVITALANNSANVQRFIDEANNAASDTATQSASLQSTWAKLPAFLEQLKPAMQKLSSAVVANTPVLINLNAAAGQLDRFFTDIPPFSRVSLPALQSLGQASVTGRVAVTAATPTVQHLNQFATHTPELAQNLAIVLHDLDDRSRAVERDPRSPGGKGYTGLEALLQYVFNQALAINEYGPFGHMLAVDAFVDNRCSTYATPGTIAQNLANSSVKNYRQCYSWLGPNQPGVNETDPSNPSGCVPDPGGHPPGLPGPTNVHACKLTAADTAAGDTSSSSSPSAGQSSAGTYAASTTNGKKTPAASSDAGGGGSGASSSGPPINLKKTISQLLSQLGGGSQSSSAGGTSAGAGGASTSGPGTAGDQGGQTMQLLNYLLAP